MKCPVSTCGAEGSGEFCHRCGTKKVDVSKDNAVISCNGKLENGSLCQAQLVKGQNFCTCCGHPVDQSLFDLLNETCSNCDTVLVVGKPFCAGCGQMRLIQGQSKTDDKLSGESTAEEVLLESNPVSDTATRNEGYSSEIKKEPILAVEEEGIHTRKEDIKGHEEHNKTSGKESQDANYTQNQSDNTDQVVAEESRSVNKDVRNELNVEKDSVETSFKPDSTEKKSNSSDDSKDSHSDATDPIKDKTLQNEEEKGSVTMDSEDDSEFDIGETKDCGGAASLGTDNDLGSGTLTGEAKKKQKKNKKKRKKDRDLSKQDDKTDDAKSKSQEIDKTKSESKEDIDKKNQEIKSLETSDMTQANPNDSDGRVFGQAKNWKTPEKVETSKPNDSSIFNTSSSNDAQGNVTPVQDEQKTTPVQDVQKTEDDFVDPKLRPPEKDKSTDEDKSSSDDENDNEGDNGNRGIQEKDGNEQLPNENQESLRETNPAVKETDIDTGQTVHIPETQTKRKKKKKKKKKSKDKATVDAGSTTQSIGVNTRSMTGNAEEEWSVTFHVLTSEDFHFDPDKYQVFIVMGNKEMGGWKNKNRQMKVERHVEGDIYELVSEVTIPFRLIDSSNYFPYKYYFKKKDKEGKYEHYIRGGKTGENVNRILYVDKKYKNFGEWHQYDGFAEREPDKVSVGKVKEVFSFKGDFKKHAEKAIHVFCPQLSDLDKVGFSNILCRIQMLFESLWKIYYSDTRCWSDKYMAFVDFFGKNLVQAMFDLWKIDRDQSTASEGEREQILNGCILVVCALHTLNINLQDSKFIQTLCKAMLIRRGKKEKQCQNYQFMEQNFQEKRQSISDILLSLVKTLAGTTKDPSWLYLMPWVHFFSGESSPFETQIVDVSHDSEKPVWWGIAKIENEVEYFKAKTGQWAIKLETILENLEPLFVMDHLLPRTFMTVINLNELEKVIMTGKIPVETCLATITYYIKIYQPDVHYYQNRCYFLEPSLEEKMVGKCIGSLLDQLKTTVYRYLY
ncbi:E3 ubiquitin-protein ligase rnf213-alpha-like [Ruditapes philippinarum]|uniref:E3 ubiquitin-protein ligase rnf213-alpha-like n=1 Tax=Ruditapes philippinarum TaxID=129788 RepID=UPI00295ABF11|nr:E3 ubiquitin-protein ligase rnf213-alpha-like [Ruditapes philippinarum]